MQRHRHNVKVSKLLVGLRPYQAYTKRHPCAVTSHREILYGPLNVVLRLDIFLTFTAISAHLAAFH